MATKTSSVKEKVLEVLKKKGAMTKDALAEEVAKELGKQPRVVKAVISKMISRGELVEEGGKVKAA